MKKVVLKTLLLLLIVFAIGITCCSCGGGQPFGLGDSQAKVEKAFEKEGYSAPRGYLDWFGTGSNNDKVTVKYDDNNKVSVICVETNYNSAVDWCNKQYGKGEYDASREETLWKVNNGVMWGYDPLFGDYSYRLMYFMSSGEVD